MADHGEREGQQLGNYRLTRLLGRGGFAEVYVGEHVHLGTEAAIKVLVTRLASREIEPFRDEARTIAHLRHLHIVRVLDFGIEDDMPFLVMDYAPNGTLRQRYPSGTILTPARILPFVQQVAQALQYAHDHRKIHRDVKPENMLLDASNDVLLSDFGIATIAHTTGSASIQDQAGTIPYMAPEQIQGKPRLASNQYALGIVIYEWLASTRPFTGTSWEILSQHLAAPPPPLRERNPTISAAIERVVERALAKDPHQRYESMEAFAQAFTDAVEHTHTSQKQSAPAELNLSTPPGTTEINVTPVQQEASDLKKAKEQWLEQGHTHYYAGEYQEAIAAYDQAIALDAADATTYNFRGSAYYALKQYQPAIADFERALSRNPRYRAAYHNRNLAYSAQKGLFLEQGNEHYHAGEYQEAIVAYDQAIAIDPNDARAYNFRGSAYLALKQYTQAITDFDQAIALKPDYSVASRNRSLAYSVLEKR